MLLSTKARMEANTILSLACNDDHQDPREGGARGGLVGEGMVSLVINGSAAGAAAAMAAALWGATGETCWGWQGWRNDRVGRGAGEGSQVVVARGLRAAAGVGRVRARGA